MLVFDEEYVVESGGAACGSSSEAAFRETLENRVIRHVARNRCALRRVRELLPDSVRAYASIRRLSAPGFAMDTVLELLEEETKKISPLGKEELAVS